MKAHFQTFAGYNQWANRRLYDAAAILPDAQYREPRGAFFGSLHGTLNHILIGDRVWMPRLTGEARQPVPPDGILYNDLASLRAAREAEDEGIIRFVDGLGEADLERMLAYRNASGQEHTTIIHEILTSLFNHHTHHRGQAHTILTGLGQPSVVLDMILYLRLRGEAA